MTESMGRRLDQCERCGQVVGADALTELDLPMTAGNPYPGTVRVCAECRPVEEAHIAAEEYAYEQDQRELRAERGECPVHGSLCGPYCHDRG